MINLTSFNPLRLFQASDVATQSPVLPQIPLVARLLPHIWPADLEKRAQLREAVPRHATFCLAVEHNAILAYRELYLPHFPSAPLFPRSAAWNWIVFHGNNAALGCLGAMLSTAFLDSYLPRWKSSSAGFILPALIGGVSITVAEFLEGFVLNGIDYADMPAGILGAGLYAGLAYLTATRQ